MPDVALTPLPKNNGYISQIQQTQIQSFFLSKQPREVQHVVELIYVIIINEFSISQIVFHFHFS